MAKIVEVQQEEELFGMDWYDPTCYATKILNTKYEKVEVDEVINQLNHATLSWARGNVASLSEFVCAGARLYLRRSIELRSQGSSNCQTRSKRREKEMQRARGGESRGGFQGSRDPVRD
jgi:hypothetical protein